MKETLEDKLREKEKEVQKNLEGRKKTEEEPFGGYRIQPREEPVGVIDTNKEPSAIYRIQPLPGEIMPPMTFGPNPGDKNPLNFPEELKYRKIVKKYLIKW